MSSEWSRVCDVYNYIKVGSIVTIKEDLSFTKKITGEVGEIDKYCQRFYIWQNQEQGNIGNILPTTKGYKYSWVVDFDSPTEIKFANIIQKGGDIKMKKAISDVFEKTTDALLVEKYMGSEISDMFIFMLIVRQNKSVILAEAKRREQEDKDK